MLTWNGAALVGCKVDMASERQKEPVGFMYYYCLSHRSDYRWLIMDIYKRRVGKLSEDRD